MKERLPPRPGRRPAPPSGEKNPGRGRAAPPARGDLLYRFHRIVIQPAVPLLAAQAAALDQIIQVGNAFAHGEIFLGKTAKASHLRL